MPALKAFLICLVGIASAPAFGSSQPIEIPTNLSGEVVVRSLDKHNLVVAVDTSNQGKVPDGVVDYTFYFTSSQLPGTPLSLDLHFANVEHTPESLRISSPRQGAILLLRLAGSTPDSALEAERSAEPWTVYDASGLGLTAYRGGSEWSMVRLSAGAGDKAGVLVPSEPEGGCDAGGLGSSSCSVSECHGTPASCTASCVAPRYACCWCAQKTGAKCSCPSL